MLGTMMPQDSLRQMRPATTRLANVGLTLFRRGLVEAPARAEAKGPSGLAPVPAKNAAPPVSTAATVGSLGAISEALGTETDDDDCETDEEELGELENSRSLESRVIVIIGGAQPWDCSNRITRAVEIYWQTIKLFQQQQAKSYCYMVSAHGAYWKPQELVFLTVCAWLDVYRLRLVTTWMRSSTRTSKQPRSATTSWRPVSLRTTSS